MDELNLPHLTVFKRGKWYYVRYPRSMHRTPQSVKTSDKLEALRRAKALERELFEQDVRERKAKLFGIVDPADARPALAYSDAARRYLDEKATVLVDGTMVSYINTLARFGDFLEKDIPITQIGIEHVYGYLSHRKAAKTKPYNRPPKDGTLRTEATQLKCFFAWCEDRGLVDRSPAFRVKLPKAPYAEKRYLDRHEFRHFLKTIDDPHFRDIVLFYTLTGCRRGEGLALSPADIDLDQMVVKIAQKKTRDSKRIPLTPELWEILNRLKAQSGDPRRFITLRPDSLTSRFKTYVQFAKLNARITFHSLRHTAGTWSYSSGHNMAQVQKFLGHRSAKSTERYANSDAAELKPLVDDLTREIMASVAQN